MCSGCLKQLLEFLGEFVALACGVDLIDADECPLCSGVGLGRLDVPVEAVGAVGEVGGVAVVGAEVFAFDVVALVGGRLQRVDVVAHLLDCPVGFGRCCAVDEACLDAGAYLAVGVGAEEHVVARECGLEIVGVGGHGAGVLEAVDEACGGHYGLCAVGFALVDVGSLAEVVDVEVLVGLELGEVGPAHGAHLLDGAEFLPYVGLGVELATAVGHVERGSADVDSAEDVAAEVDGGGVGHSHAHLAELGATVEGIVAYALEIHRQAHALELGAAHEGSVVDAGEVLGQHDVLERRARLELVACEVLKLGEVLKVGKVFDGSVAGEDAAERGDACGLAVGYLAIAVGIDVLYAYVAHGRVDEGDEVEALTQTCTGTVEVFVGGRKVVVYGALVGGVEFLFIGNVEEVLELCGALVVALLCLIVGREHPLTVGGVVGVDDIAVGAVGGRCCVAGVGGLYAEVLLSVVAAYAGGRLHGVDVRGAFYEADLPVGALVGNV